MIHFSKIFHFSESFNGFKVQTKRMNMKVKADTREEIDSHSHNSKCLTVYCKYRSSKIQKKNPCELFFCQNKTKAQLFITVKLQIFLLSTSCFSLKDKFCSNQALTAKNTSSNLSPSSCYFHQSDYLANEVH